MEWTGGRAIARVALDCKQIFVSTQAKAKAAGNSLARKANYLMIARIRESNFPNFPFTFPIIIIHFRESFLPQSAAASHQQQLRN